MKFKIRIQCRFRTVRNRLCTLNVISPFPKLNFFPGHKCVCDANSTETFEYDNNLKRPICEKGAMRPVPRCPLRYVNATKFSSIRKSVRIIRDFKSENCSCNEKGYENYRGEYCIKSELFKDFKGYQMYKNLPLTHSLNLTGELRFIAFFCKVLHQRSYCNYLANLCVLTSYDLDRNGPCYPFYKQQSQQSELSIDEVLNEASEIDGGEKLKPFLFFRSQKSARNLLDKSIDFKFSLHDVSHKTNFPALTIKQHSHCIAFVGRRLTAPLTSPLSVMGCAASSLKCAR